MVATLRIYIAPQKVVATVGNGFDRSVELRFFRADENPLRHFLTKMPPPSRGRQITPAAGIDVFVGNVVPDVPRNAEDSVPYSRI